MLGDVALGRINETLALVGGLNGRKVLLAGNHDRCWAGHGRRSEGWTERYLAAGFAEVHQGQTAINVGEFSRATSHIEATATITTGSSSIVQSTEVIGCSTATSTNGGASTAA